MSVGEARRSFPQRDPETKQIIAGGERATEVRSRSIDSEVIACTLVEHQAPIIRSTRSFGL